ncbi:hypothetical protein [Streptomyces sp. NPDC002692]
MGIRLPHRRPALPAGAVPALFAPVPAVAAGASTAQTPAARRAGRTPGPAAPASRSTEAAAAPAAATYRDTGAPPAHADGSGPTCDLASECQYDPEGFADGADGETVPRRAQRLRDTLDRWELAVLNPLVAVSDSIAALRLPEVVTGTGSFLRSRVHGLNPLGHVRGEVRADGPAGTPGDARARRGNGPLPRPAHGWRVRSVGAFTRTGGTCRIVVLSHDNPTTAYRARAIGRIARAVHRGLGQGRGPARGQAARGGLSGRPDGSAPYARLPARDEPEPDATP